MTERATPYRNELEALRARRADLEERLEAERAEAGRQREEVKALRQELARRDGKAAPSRPEGGAAGAGRDDEGRALAPNGGTTPPAPSALVPNGATTPPAPRRLVPNEADPKGHVAQVALCFALSLLLFTKVLVLQMGGFMVLTMGLPMCLCLARREKMAQRYLELDAKGVEFRGYDRKVRRIVWSDVESKRMVIKQVGRHHALALQLGVRGHEDRVELDYDYLSGAEELADLVDLYRRG